MKKNILIPCAIILEINTFLIYLATKNIDSLSDLCAVTIIMCVSVLSAGVAIVINFKRLKNHEADPLKDTVLVILIILMATLHIRDCINYTFAITAYIK